MLYVLYILYSCNKVSQRKENIRKTIKYSIALCLSETNLHVSGLRVQIHVVQRSALLLSPPVVKETEATEVDRLPKGTHLVKDDLVFIYLHLHLYNFWSDSRACVNNAWRVFLDFSGELSPRIA